MHFLWTILIGFLIGLMARFFMPGKQKAGFIMTTLLGIIGSFVGTYLGQWLGWYAPWQGAGFIASVIGAMIILGFARLFA